MCLFSFRKLNPDWDMTLWVTGEHGDVPHWETGEVQDFAIAGGKNYWDQIKPLNIDIKPWIPPGEFRKATPVHQSDLCRWAVLGEYGGWYADTDILWVDSMERAEKWAGANGGSSIALVAQRDHVPIGFLGAKPGQRFFRELYLAAKSNYSATNYQSAGADALAKAIGGISKKDGFGMRHNSKWPSMKEFVIKAFPDQEFCWMPVKSVYPWDWTQVAKIFGQDVGVPNSDVIGIHWYGGSKLAQKFNAKLDEGNFRAYGNTFVHYCRNLIDNTGD